MEDADSDAATDVRFDAASDADSSDVVESDTDTGVLSKGWHCGLDGNQDDRVWRRDQHRSNTNRNRERRCVQPDHEGGGSSGTLPGGAAYDPNFDIWTAMLTSGEPSKRIGATVVWTGKLALVFGGKDGTTLLGDGGYYVP